MRKIILREKKMSGLLIQKALFLLLLAPVALARLDGTGGGSSSGGYRLKQRQRQTAETVFLTLEQLQNSDNYRLSWSQDSDPIPLSAFYLSVFDTAATGLSADPSIATIQSAVDAFLTAELNSVYDVNNQVRTVGASVLDQTAAESSRRRVLQDSSGTQLETAVEVQFAYQPTPPAEDVQAKVISILEGDLTNLVSNVTSRAANDPELANVNAVYYMGLVSDSDADGDDFVAGGGAVPPPPPPPTAPAGAPTNSDAVLDGMDTSTNRTVASDTSIVIPLVIAACVALMVVALFMYRRHRMHRSDRSVHSPELDSTGLHTKGDASLYYTPNDKLDPTQEDMMLLDETDIFSVEAALSPTSKAKAAAKYAEYDQEDEEVAFNDMEDGTGGTQYTSNNVGATGGSVPGGGAIFCAGAAGATAGVLAANSTMGMDSPKNTMAVEGSSSSPRHGPTESRSVFSFLSGFASRGEASTVVASNVTKSLPNTKLAGGVSDGSALSPASGENGHTPHSKQSSLFTFSEDDDDEDDDGIDMGELTDEQAAAMKRRRQQRMMRQAAEIQVTTSEEEEAKSPRSKPQALQRYQQPEPRLDGEDIVMTMAPGDGDANDKAAVGCMALGAGMAAGAGTAWLVDKYSKKDGDGGDTTDDDSLDHLLDSKKKNQEIMKDLALAEEEAQKQKQQRGWNAALCTSAAAAHESSPEADDGGSWCGDDGNSICPRTQPYKGPDDSTNPSTPTKTTPTTSPRGSQAIQLNFDDPAKVQENKVAMAAFAEQVASASFLPTDGEDETTNSSASSSPPESKTITSRELPPPRRGFHDKAIPPSPSNDTKTTSSTLGVQSNNTHSTTSTDERYEQLTNRASPRHAGRRSAGSAGFADGTSSYQNDTANAEELLDVEDVNSLVDGGNSRSSLSFQRGAGKPLSPEEVNQYLSTGSTGGLAVLTAQQELESSSDRARIHTKNTAADGSTNYQNETMETYSIDEMDDDPGTPGSTNSESRKRRMRMSLKQVVFGSKKNSKKPPQSPGSPDPAPMSPTKSAALMAASPASTENSQGSPSKQLISDLLWLEQKIAATNQAPVAGDGGPGSPTDSLSFASHDDEGTAPSMASSSAGSSYPYRSGNTSGLNQSIVCRDCYAPPGKLKIVIHSTKDGPAVHTVKKGSSLEGHIFPGDLIISVDNVDTRSYSAEQVMKMMTAKTRFERKITVLHFEDESGAESSTT